VRRLKVECEKLSDRVKLEVRGVPATIGANDMLSCRVTATNTSQRDLPITPNGWFQLEVKPPCGYLVEHHDETKGSTILKAGQAVSQEMDIVLQGDAETTTLIWTFLKK
jgi:hypothetical protein